MATDPDILAREQRAVARGIYEARQRAGLELSCMPAETELSAGAHSAGSRRLRPRSYELRGSVYFPPGYEPDSKEKAYRFRQWQVQNGWVD